MTIFNVGDLVWTARDRGKRKEIICPDCFGTRHLVVTLGNGEQHTIDCAGCRAGYEPPLGIIQTWEYEPSVEHGIVTEVTLSSGGASYRVGCLCFEQSDVFAEKEQAMERAEKYAKESQEREDAKFLRKDKNNRTWAWHVHWHRREIRDAEKKLAYHRAKLEVARKKAKESP